MGKIPEDIGIYVFVVLFYGEMWCLPRRKCDIAAKDIGLLPHLHLFGRLEQRKRKEPKEKEIYSMIFIHVHVYICP